VGRRSRVAVHAAARLPRHGAGSTVLPHLAVP
jgi:hypothetical protein